MVMGYRKVIIRNFAEKITSFQIAMRYGKMLGVFDMLKFDKQVANICKNSVSTGKE